MIARATDNSAHMDAETTQMLSMVNEDTDCVVIINSDGVIQYTNKGMTKVELQSVQW